MNAVIVAPHGARQSAVLRDQSGARLIGLHDDADVIVPGSRGWAVRVRRMLGASFPARIMLRFIGADTATQFARAVRTVPEAVRALESADLIVAADEDAVLAAWQAVLASRGRSRGVFGLAAARVALKLPEGPTS